LFPSDFPIETHLRAINKIFEKEDKVTSSRFHDAIITAYESMGIKFGQSKARHFVEYVRQMNLVKVEDKQTGNRTFFTLADISVE
jgi:hypothetical protein